MSSFFVLPFLFHLAIANTDCKNVLSGVEEFQREVSLKKIERSRPKTELVIPEGSGDEIDWAKYAGQNVNVQRPMPHNPKFKKWSMQTVLPTSDLDPEIADVIGTIRQASHYRNVLGRKKVREAAVYAIKNSEGKWVFGPLHKGDSNSVGLTPSQLKEFFSKFMAKNGGRDNVREIAMIHTHPNRTPLSYADFVQVSAMQEEFPDLTSRIIAAPVDENAGFVFQGRLHPGENKHSVLFENYY